MTDNVQIEVNDVDRWDSGLTGDGHIVFVFIGRSDCAPNPAEDWDGFGKFHSFSHRHINYNPSAAELLGRCECPKCGGDNVDVEYAGRTGPVVHCYDCCEDDEVYRAIPSDCIPLGYFEHGRCDWHVSGEIPWGTEGDYRWDGVRFAGVWEPDECIIEQANSQFGKGHSNERLEWMEQQARQACDTYTKWCNGDVYGYNVEVYKERKENGRLYDRIDDYRFQTPVADDSCWGFYDTEYMFEEINSLTEGFGVEVVQ